MEDEYLMNVTMMYSLADSLQYIHNINLLNVIYV